MKATVLVAGSVAILVAGCSAPPVHEPPVSEPPVSEPPVSEPPVSEPATVSEPPVVGVEPEIKPPVRPAVSDSETLLTYVDHVRKLPAAEFADAEAGISRSFRHLLHVDDPAQINVIRRVAEAGASYTTSSVEEEQRTQMLAYQLEHSGTTTPASPAMKILVSIAAAITAPSAGWP